MKRFPKPLNARSPRLAAATIAALTGVATVALVSVALGNTFTLQVAKNAPVTNQAGTTKDENIAVSHGFAVYTLTGDSRRHPKCTKASSCLAIWPPVTVSSSARLRKAPGIEGKLGVWHRNGFFQLTLGGHPLYRFAPDTRKDRATGEGIHSFGGTWHVVAATDAPTAGSTMPTSPTTTTMAGPIPGY